MNTGDGGCRARVGFRRAGTALPGKRTENRLPYYQAEWLVDLSKKFAAGSSAPDDYEPMTLEDIRRRDPALAAAYDATHRPDGAGP